MPHQIIPSVEKRIFSWIEIQKKRIEQDMEGDKPNVTITISREFGCEGYPLVAALEEKLSLKTGQSWTIFDNHFIDKLVEDQETSMYLAKSLGDRTKYLDYIFSTLIPSRKSDSEVFKQMVEAIYLVARQGNAIILEHGAFAITKNLPNCYHFRLIAPLEYRISSYSRRTGISHEKASDLVVKKEKDRTRFLSDFLNCSFDKDCFHLEINNSKLPIEKIADCIIGIIDFN